MHYPNVHWNLQKNNARTVADITSVAVRALVLMLTRWHNYGLTG